MTHFIHLHPAHFFPGAIYAVAPVGVRAFVLYWNMKLWATPSGSFSKASPGTVTCWCSGDSRPSVGCGVPTSSRSCSP